jgi:hypothetical protein
MVLPTMHKDIIVDINPMNRKEYFERHKEYRERYCGQELNLPRPEHSGKICSVCGTHLLRVHMFMGSPGYHCNGCDAPCRTPVEINLDEYYKDNPDGPLIPEETPSGRDRTSELGPVTTENLEGCLEPILHNWFKTTDITILRQAKADPKDTLVWKALMVCHLIFGHGHPKKQFMKHLPGIKVNNAGIITNKEEVFK